MAEMTQVLADSDIVFQRGQSNAPFPPLAFLSASSYGDAEVASDSRVTDSKVEELDFDVGSSGFISFEFKFLPSMN